MPVIVDTNVLHLVFRKKTDFSPVMDWINGGKGVFVFGGTKYIHELGGYIKIFLEFKKKGKAKLINKELVDNKEIELKEKIGENKCDDHHLIAMVAISNCPIIATLDKRAFPYIKDSDNYPKGFGKPKIYSSVKNVNLFVGKSANCLRNVS